MNEIDFKHLEHCIELAKKALELGDEPFGSVLVSADGKVLFKDHNHVATTGDNTQHPEFTIARWAAMHMTAEERANATVYTSGEHCPMCSAAHAWNGLGRIVYASSSEQLTEWKKEMGNTYAPIKALSIHEVAPHLEIEGPVPELAEKVKALHIRSFQSKKDN